MNHYLVLIFCSYPPEINFAGKSSKKTRLKDGSLNFQTSHYRRQAPRVEKQPGIYPCNTL